MPRPVGGLEAHDPPGRLRRRVQRREGAAPVLGVDLLAQHAALERPVGLPALGGVQPGGDRGLRQVVCVGIRVAVLGGVGRRQRALLLPGAGVEPRLRAHRRQRDDQGAGSRLVVVAHRLGVPLLDHAEAAELALLAVEEAVMVGVFVDEAPAGDAVDLLQLGQTLHREGQARGPGAAGATVGQVERGRRRVGQAGRAPQAVVDRGQQPRLPLGHQLHVVQRPNAPAHRDRSPDQARRAVPEQVDDLHLLGAGLRAHPLEQRGVRPAVARLVEPQAHAVAAHVQQVGGPAAVEVREPDPARVERVGPIEARRALHVDARPEAAVAQRRPVAHRAVADPHHVGEPVAAHVGEEELASVAGEQKTRPLVLVVGQRDGEGGIEALAALARVDDEPVALGHEQLGDAVAVEVDEAAVGVVGAVRGQAPEGAEARPAAVRGAGLVAGPARAHHDHVEVAVAVEVRELGAGPAKVHVRAAAQGAGPGEGAFALVALVEPGATPLREQPGHALAVEVDHPPRARVERLGKLALALHGAHRRVDGRRGP